MFQCILTVAVVVVTVRVIVHRFQLQRQHQFLCHHWMSKQFQRVRMCVIFIQVTILPVVSHKKPTHFTGKAIRLLLSWLSMKHHPLWKKNGANCYSWIIVNSINRPTCFQLTAPTSERLCQNIDVLMTHKHYHKHSYCIMPCSHIERVL
jgi:hypothetical protein